MVVRPKYVTPTAPTPEHACPMRRRVRRSAKKAFHVSWGWAPGELLAAGAGEDCAVVVVDEVEAWRVPCIMVVRLRPLGRVRIHVDDAVVPAIDDGASMAGGKRFAKALAGHNALLESIVMCCVLPVTRVVGRGSRCGWSSVVAVRANFLASVGRLLAYRAWRY